jgi:hypothetical protein
LPPIASIILSQVAWSTASRSDGRFFPVRRDPYDRLGKGREKEPAAGDRLVTASPVRTAYSRLEARSRFASLALYHFRDL